MGQGTRCRLGAGRLGLRVVASCWAANPWGADVRDVLWSGPGVYRSGRPEGAGHAKTMSSTPTSFNAAAPLQNTNDKLALGGGVCVSTGLARRPSAGLNRHSSMPPISCQLIDALIRDLGGVAA